MILIRPVSCLEVKRCFVISDKAKPERSLTKKEFLTRLIKVKKEVLAFAERELDSFIAKDPERLWIYNKVKWSLATVSTNEIAVWPRAGGLPLGWTNNDNSLKETSNKVFRAIKEDGRRVNVNERVRCAVRGIVREADVIKKEKYLYPIVLFGGRAKRKGSGSLNGVIDDGNMRGIAFTGNGGEDLTVYVGLVDYFALDGEDVWKYTNYAC